MNIRLGIIVVVVALWTVTVSAGSIVDQVPTLPLSSLIDRFLARDHEPLVSYRAFRRLTASTRGGRMQATIEAWTTLDPVKGFTFEITNEEGAAVIRHHVL